MLLPAHQCLLSTFQKDVQLSSPEFTAEDFHFMAMALRLAEQGRFTTTPNPRVGCVLVKDGKHLAEAAHLKAGELHAEALALLLAGTAAQGATAYVTLEPCSHHGRTPPCADALIAAGIKRVVVAMSDPNPLVSGKGLQRLREHGLEVAVGLMRTEAEALNPGFISRMQRGRPFVRIKLAASLDGKTGLNNGMSQWISSASSRQDVQFWRASACAILTGIGTVLADNPAMNVRLPHVTRQPLRVVLDSQLRTPLNANIFASGETWLMHAMRQGGSQQAGAESGDAILSGRPSGSADYPPQVRVFGMPVTADGRVSLVDSLEHLARHGLQEVLVEAGATLNGRLLAEGLVDEILLYQAPMLLGTEARGMFALPPLIDMQQRIALELLDVRQIGKDMRLRLKPIQAV